MQGLSLQRAALLALAWSFFVVTTEARAQVPARQRPYAVFVNGNGNCCTWEMRTVINFLRSRNIEIRRTPHDHFADGALQRGQITSDEDFLREGAEFLNNQLEPGRPLILIGHSFGGDSLVKLVPRLRRPVQLLAVLDPTGRGGVRSEVVGREIPAHVVYFYNRWQQNPLGSIYNAFPIDGRITNGNFARCLAGTCDQTDQNLRRRADGSDIRVQCSWYEFCSTKGERLYHTDIPLDELVQAQIIDIISRVVP